MIWRLYKYLFYQNYLNNLKGEWNWGNWAPIWAAGGMAFTSMGYFSAAIMFIAFFGYAYPSTILASNKLGIFLLLLIGPVLHYFLFLYRNRYKKIIQEFQPVDNAKFRKKGTIIFWTYVIGSMISFAIAGLLMAYSVNTGFTVLGYFGILGG